MSPLLASLRRVSAEPDPVLLQGREGRWRWPWVIAGLLLTAAIFALLGFVVFTFEDVATKRNWIAGDFPDNVLPLDPAQPITYLDVLLASLPFLVPPLLVLPIVHRVPWRRAFAYPGVAFRWHQYWRAALALLAVSLLSLAVGFATEPMQYSFPRPQAAIWIVLALAIIFVQSLGEEVLFRGYLMRACGAVFPFRLPITAAILGVFVSAHLDNDDIKRDLLLNAAYFIAGEVVAYAVWFRTQNLAASAGLHWMNNVVALLMPTVPGQPTALALAVYTDAVYVAGGSRLLDPLTHAAEIGSLVLLVALLFWRRSPFYLEAPAAPVNEEAQCRSSAHVG